MNKSTITREQAQKIIVAADEVITALAGNNEDVHPDDSKKMCDLWDDLNDRYAPPEVVRELARMALAAMDSEPVEESVTCWSCRNEVEISAIGDRDGYCPICDAPIDLDEEPYNSPQPAPVVSEGLISELEQVLDWILNTLPVPTPLTIPNARRLVAVINACRAAMLQAEPVTTANKLGTSGNSGLVPVPDEFLSVSQNEHGMFELSEDCMCRLAVALSQQNKGLVAPPGYVMVPKEPTDEMIAAAMNCDDVLFNSDESFCVQFGNIYEAMLAAAPQLPGNDHATVSGKWIPVSERMPDDSSDVLCTAEFDGPGDWRKKVGYWHEGKWVVYGASWTPTHWMPLPAAPQEVKGE
ncbi:TPA: DUF551 domain-containing protein [Klebsiella aerogenes]|nr:DUF551 domain-containing protein [Klebsiella aerogenes]